MKARSVARAALVMCSLGACDASSVRARNAGFLAECTFNDECTAPLLCAARRCRAPCRTDRDCLADWRCLSAGAVDKFVCYAPDDLDTACVWPSHCLRGRVCSPERVCRPQCRADYDCQTIRRDLTCNVAAGVCAGHPFLDDAGALADVLRNDPAPNVDPVVALGVVPDAGVGGDAAAGSDGGAVVCGPSTATGACVPGAPGCDLLDVSISGRGSCALFTGGTVRCWSATETREARYVGNGSTVGCGSPWLVDGLTGVRSLHQGTWATCAVRAGEAVPVWCWGYNYRGQLGRAGPDPLRPAGAPIPAEGLVLGGGSGFSIAPGGAGVVTAWGNNQSGQLGDGTTEPAGSMAGVAPHAVSLPGLQQLSVASQTACGVFAGAEVRCWGKGETGQFGAAMLPVAPETRSSTPVLVPGINRAVDVRLDGTSVCALRDDATVWCWGRELFPMGRYRVNIAPRQVVDRATQLVMAGASCALRDDGTVWCWTYIPGPDERTSEIRLAQVPGLMGVRRLYAGLYTTCAWMGGADLRCWGQELGVAGAGSLGFSDTPVRIVF